MQKCVEHAVPTRLTQTFTKDARLLFQSGSATVIDNSHAEGKKSVSVCVYGMVEHAVMLFLLMGIVISTNEGVMYLKSPNPDQYGISVVILFLHFIIHLIDYLEKELIPFLYFVNEKKNIMVHLLAFFRAFNSIFSSVGKVLLCCHGDGLVVLTSCTRFLSCDNRWSYIKAPGKAS